MRCVPTHASRRTPPHLAPVAGEVFLRRNHPARTQPARPDAPQPPRSPPPPRPRRTFTPSPRLRYAQKGTLQLLN